MADAHIPKDSQLDELMRICSDVECKTKGTYQIAASCPNCGWRGGVTLTRGHRFQGFTTDCPRCACAGLMRV